MLATGNDISSADAGNLDPLLPTCSHFARTMPTSTPQDLFDAVRKVWSQSIHHDPDHPSLPCSLYAPILAAVLAIAAPSYSRTASELIIELYDHTLERLEPYPEQKSASGEDEPRYPRALRTPGDLRDQVLALGGKQRARLVLALRIREALVKSWPLAGFPRLIGPLGALSTHIASQKPDILPLLHHIESLSRINTPTTLTNLDAPNLAQNPMVPRPPVTRGIALFEHTYAQHTERVLEALGHAHPSLPPSAISLIYTPVLSQPDVLLPHPLSTSLLCLVLCFGTGLEPQAKGHYYGAKNCIKSSQEAIAKNGSNTQADDAAATATGQPQELQGGEGEAVLDEGISEGTILRALHTVRLAADMLGYGVQYQSWKWLPEEVWASR